MEKNEFYFQGKSYDTLDQLIKGAKEWRFMTLNQETCRSLLKTCCNNIMLTIFMNDVKLTNGDMRFLLEELFLELLQKVLKKAE